MLNMIRGYLILITKLGDVISKINIMDVTAGVGAPGRMHIHSARGIFDNGALVGDDG
jgi:hypothetical protein